MEFLLDKNALKGLTAEEQQTVKDQALNQFLLGSVFGGGGIATGYQAVQNIIPNLQKQKQQQGLLQELTGIQQEFFPTQTQAGQRALGAEGRGPTLTAAENQQAILNQPIDLNAAYTRLGRLATNPNATAMLPGLTSAFQSLQPKVQGDLVLNANQQILRGLPTQKEGIVSQYNPLTRGYSAAPVQNYMQSRIESTPPEISTNTMLVPMQGGGFTQQVIPGATGAITAIKGAEAVGQAQGQVEQVIGADGKTYFVPRSSLLTQRPTGATGVVTGGAPSGGVAKISPAQEAVNLATSNRYNEFTKTALDAALTVGDRKTSAEYLYNAAEQLDPNKLTEFFSTGAAYMRAIPGVGDKFDSLVGNVNLLNKTRSEGVLKGLSNIKGNANAFEGGIVDKATTGVTDPKFVTKYVSALEIAAADKDDARQRFIDAYTGDPKAVYTAWANSPDNPRLYNHPKVNQFLNEQIASWQQGGSQGTPVMPSGFTVGRSKSTGAILIKKPDGSTYTIGQ
jgi:hypothetical protein